ncbi:hypothetical protein AUJ67_06985 [Candidatus Desantisbacteria bacterium CG1_02_49_89]|nr:MAG: hypothetical protein AUJ67_06985 [Candidatus Desantisbacteria bacterium CG1_02_49_89]
MIENANIRLTVNTNGTWGVMDKATNETWSSNIYNARFGLCYRTGVGTTVLNNFSLGTTATRVTLTSVTYSITIYMDIANNAMNISYDTTGTTLDWIQLVEDGLWTRQADNGYMLIPLRMGILLPADSSKSFSWDFYTYRGGCDIAMMGASKNGSAVLARWEDPYIWPNVRSTTGSGTQTLSSTIYSYRGAYSPPGKKGIRLVFLGTGDWDNICSTYRSEINDTWALTWDEKNDRNLDKLFGASSVKLWGTLWRSMNDASNVEQSKGIDWTFQEVGEVADHFKNDLQAENVLFQIGGWINRGYDNRHPDILPAAPECGGNVPLTATSKKVREDLNYLFGFHDNYQDYYDDATSIDSHDYIIQNPAGTYVRGGKWAGGWCWLICSQMGLQLAQRPQNMPMVKQLFNPTFYFTDTTFVAELMECFAPAHPETLRGDMYYKQQLCDYERSLFGFMGSEDGREWAVPHATFFEGIGGAAGKYNYDMNPLDAAGAIDIPLFSMVYHDCVVPYGKYGYGVTGAAPYVMYHLSGGFPLNYHSNFGNNHLFWKTLDTSFILPISPGVQSATQTGTNTFQITYKWDVFGEINSNVTSFIHFETTPLTGGTADFQNDHGLTPPTNEWTVGTYIDGPYNVTIPSPGPDTYTISMGLFEPSSGQRASLQGDDDGTLRYRAGYIVLSAGPTITFVPPDTTTVDTTNKAVFCRADNGWAEGMYIFDRFFKNTHEFLSPLHELTAKMLITNYEFLTPDYMVRRITFGSGAVRVGYNTGSGDYDYTCLDASVAKLPPYGFVIEAPNFIAFHALSWQGLNYDSSTYFTYRSLDGKPIATSNRIRVYHGFGDPRVIINGETRVVYREAILCTSTAVSETLSYLQVEPSVTPADGFMSSMITVRVRDTNGNALPNKTVTLKTSRGTGVDSIVQPSLTDSSGVCVGYISSKTAGADTVTATCDGLTITQCVDCNPSFEDGQSRPEYWTRNQGDNSFEWDYTVYKTGLRSAKIENARDTNTWTNWEQIVDVTPGSVYRFTGWLRTGVMAGGCSAAFFVHNLQTSESAIISQSWTTSVGASSSPWTKYTIGTITAENTCVKMRLGCSIYQGATGGSTAWFDDVRLARVPTITFSGSSPPAGKTMCFLEVSSPAAEANGKASCTVTVTVRTETAVPLSGKRVTIYTSRGSVIDTVVQPGLTDGNGQCTGTISSWITGDDTVTAVCDGNTIYQNLIINYSFEEGDVWPDPWGKNNWSPDRYYCYVLDSTVACSGAKSAKTENDQVMGFINWEQTLNAVPGSAYKFTGCSKTDTMGAGDTCYFIIHHLVNQADGYPKSQDQVTVTTPYSAWTQHTLNPAVESDVNWFRIICAYNQADTSGATVWYDDLSLRRSPTISFVGASRLAITTPQRFLTTSDYESIVIQAQWSDGTKATNFNGICTITSSSSTGRFLAPGSTIWSAYNYLGVNIVSGETFVYFRDSRPGSPTVTVTSYYYMSETSQLESVSKGAFSNSMSYMIAKSSMIAANGTNPCTVAVFVGDYFRNPLPGNTVTLMTTNPAGNDTITYPDGQLTDTAGFCTAALVSSLMGLDTITATIQSSSNTITRIYFADIEVGIWAFEETAGIVARDFSNYGNTGTMTGSIRWGPGRFGHAMNSDGTNDYIIVPHSSSLNLTQQMSVEMWIYPRNASKMYNRLINKAWDLEGSFIMMVYSNQAHFGLMLDGVQRNAIGGVINNNGWTHLVGTYDGLNIRLYANGSQVASGAYSKAFGNTYVIGISGGGTGDCFDGLLDEIRIYERALQLDEIRARYDTAVLPIPVRFTASKFVFTSSPATVPQNNPSSQITFEAQDELGTKDTNFTYQVFLYSSSPTGKFSVSSASWVDTTNIYLSAGAGAIYYKDSTIGIFTITASRTGVLSGTQSIEVVAGIPPYPGTSVKTVEYFIDQATGDRASGVSYPSTPFYIYIPESGFTLRSAWIEVAFQVGNVVVGAGSAIGVNGANTTTFGALASAGTGDDANFGLRYNATQAFLGLAGGGVNNVPYYVAVSVPALRYNESVKLYLTYEYDDGAHSQVKTVRYFAGSNNASIASGSTATYVHTPYIPETGYSIQSAWYEIRGHYYSPIAGTDLTSNINLNGTNLQAGVKLVEGAARTDDDFLYFYEPSSNPNIGSGNTLTINVNGSAVYCLGAELVITYSFNYLASANLIQTVRRYLGQTDIITGGAESPAKVYMQTIYFPEKIVSPAIRSIYAVFRTTNAANTSFNIGQNGLDTLAFAAEGSAMAEGPIMLYNLTPQYGSASDGTNVVVGSWWSALGGGSRSAEIVYTYEYPKNPSQVQKTVFFGAITGNAL